VTAKGERNGRRREDDGSKLVDRNGGKVGRGKGGVRVKIGEKVHLEVLPPTSVAAIFTLEI